MQTFDEWFYSTPAGSTKMVCESFNEDVSDSIGDGTDFKEAAHAAEVMKDWLKEAFYMGQSK
jgi:hypothetical protein